MINSLINSKFFTGLAATATFAGVMASAGIANAAALIGGFQFSSGLDVVKLTKDDLNFNPNPSTLSISILTATGSFEQFGNTSTTTINGPVEFDTLLDPNNNTFIDFGSGNTFGLQKASIGEVIGSGDNAALDIQLYGTFFSAEGDQSQGAGNITLQFNDTASAIKEQLDAGDTLTAQFSGAVFSDDEFGGGFLSESVPEPSAILGLGLFAGAGFLSKKKASNKA
ncbi:MAG: PEP-CTERM sorting domain-containing protein [Okeania sp. SIO1H6]|nr:PEP-CTERM sorting domain-containing protein [Okeania sp. SIO1H6]